VTASILLKELDLKARLPLLVDTGASNTIILWRDVERLGIDISKLKPEREFSGIGGLVEAKPILSMRAPALKYEFLSWADVVKGYLAGFCVRIFL